MARPLVCRVSFSGDKKKIVEHWAENREDVSNYHELAQKIVNQAVEEHIKRNATKYEEIFDIEV